MVGTLAGFGGRHWVEIRFELLRSLVGLQTAQQPALPGGQAQHQLGVPLNQVRPPARRSNDLLKRLAAVQEVAARAVLAVQLVVEQLAARGLQFVRVLVVVEELLVAVREIAPGPVNAVPGLHEVAAQLDLQLRLSALCNGPVLSGIALLAERVALLRAERVQAIVC